METSKTYGYAIVDTSDHITPVIISGYKSPNAALEAGLEEIRKHPARYFWGDQYCTEGDSLCVGTVDETKVLTQDLKMDEFLLDHMFSKHGDELERLMYEASFDMIDDASHDHRIVIGHSKKKWKPGFQPDDFKRIGRTRDYHADIKDAVRAFCRELVAVHSSYHVQQCIRLVDVSVYTIEKLVHAKMLTPID